MEIISYVLSGNIAHKDSEGNEKILPPGEFQLMSAGTGIEHSEYNPSLEEKLHFLQIWIEPNRVETTPDYQQKPFPDDLGFTLIASPDGENGSLVIKQDMKLYQLIIAPGEEYLFPLVTGRRVYLHQVSGNTNINSISLEAGDGMGINSAQDVLIQNTCHQEAVKLLVFDLP
jgi:redox-sensitive bicupin YhaK (pirin superfamily)